ncbi:hypothetical protein HMPREF2532_04952 [Bacteroides ovatus]|uniref:Uncharacterized protein n=1 Tax=Bacteroides ovatus (strain ATCC 8483 / DSM 1896 / JCM 5824 / BCRC 10623 / CCUG 4943 / NCTC 11153) TaxID=411476 RepID=A0AAN3ABL3_BACO1|nr:hypothetical protein BACOVA_01419 [Bacteroides ovatus ATCC 8483]EEO56572.1 hypothetical protein BSCG_03500 [Bacteroides sp. 2_2_4]KXT41077.1 hypothetical protein HMPREF2532_04952 [Bacteroides ovatus]
MSCSTFVTGSVSYVRAARFVFFQDHFFTRTLIFFRLTASPMTEPQNSLKNV